VAGIREVVPLRTGPSINDARQIDRKVLADYAAYLRDAVRRGDLAVSTAQNRLSSVRIARRCEATQYYYLLTVRLLARRAMGLQVPS